MSEEELKELEEAHKATTPDWAIPGGDERKGALENTGLVGNGLMIANFVVALPPSQTPGVASRMDPATLHSNRDFAVLAHQKLPALLAEVRLLRAVLGDAAGLDGAPVGHLERYRKALEGIVRRAREGLIVPHVRDAMAFHAASNALKGDETP